MNNLSTNLTEYVGLSSQIDEEYDVYKEHNIEKIIRLSKETPPVSEITQVFVECNILEHTVIKGFSSISVDGLKTSENICFLQGELNLSIQYIEDNAFGELSVINTKEYFSTFIMLPDNYILESDLIIKSYIDYAKVSKVSSTQLFLYVNSNITIGIY